MARVLVIDDDDMILGMYREVIEFLEHDVVTLNRAEPGFEYLRSGADVDLLITDIIMPGMDGVELVSTILASLEIPSFPIIMISGEVFGRDLSALLKHERVTFIQKPIQIGDLMAAINVRLNWETKICETP